jgi:hypothetical protein
MAVAVLYPVSPVIAAAAALAVLLPAVSSALDIVDVAIAAQVVSPSAVASTVRVPPSRLGSVLSRFTTTLTPVFVPFQ